MCSEETLFQLTLGRGQTAEAVDLVLLTCGDTIRDKEQTEQQRTKEDDQRDRLSTVSEQYISLTRCGK